MTTETQEQEYTREEIRDQFLDTVRCYVKIWHNEPTLTEEEKLNGLAFSMLAFIDGGTNMPCFKLIADTHPSDKQYNIDNGEKYYPEDCDIAGDLHEHFYLNNKPIKK